MSTFNEVNNVRATTESRIGGFFNGVSARFAQYRTYRKTLEELESLTDRELSDLGISRHSVRAIAYRAAYDG